jgi:hypothetical protein
MSAYPNLKRAGIWLGSQFIPAIILFAAGYTMGFDRGQDAGRLEMKCAILAAAERISGATAPGTITLGCEKRPTHPKASAA